jgi:hypothetical protein
VLKVDGWWALSFRICDRTFILRNEEAPTASSAPTVMAEALTAKGLVPVGADLPGIALLTYTSLDLGYAPWVLWSTDLATGEADLNAKATEESFLGESPASGPVSGVAGGDYVRGARQVAGAPTRVLVTVGVDDGRAGQLAVVLADCRIEKRSFADLRPGDCGSLLPTVVLVDATNAAGGAFVAALQADAGLLAPVVAVTAGGGMHEGAAATVDSAEPASAWVETIRALLR